jgi:hypothetical protein
MVRSLEDLLESARDGGPHDILVSCESLEIIADRISELTVALDDPSGYWRNEWVDAVAKLHELEQWKPEALKLFSEVQRLQSCLGTARSSIREADNA